MNDPVQKDIDEIHQKLRTIDDELGHLGVQRGPKRRFPGENRGANGVPLGRKPITFNEHPSFAKRRRGDSARDDEDDEMEDERPRRTVQSTVVMPVIDTKSREEKIEELVKTEKKEVANRNRRMFSNLLMGTLSKFKKDENKGAERKQAEKLVEVEKKLQEIKRQDKEKVIQERQALMDQRREKERELRQLTRKKALIQYAEAKKSHYRLLSNFIQTTTKPVIFYLPAKHTVRSLEMLKNSEKAIEGLIELREKDLQRDLDNSHEHSDGEGETIKSFVSKGKESEKRKRERRESRSSSSAESEDEKPAEPKAEEEADDGEENLPEVVEDGGDDEDTKE